jgi:hypothetical protein
MYSRAREQQAGFGLNLEQFGRKRVTLDAGICCIARIQLSAPGLAGSNKKIVVREYGGRREYPGPDCGNFLCEL